MDTAGCARGCRTSGYILRGVARPVLAGANLAALQPVVLAVDDAHWPTAPRCGGWPTWRPGSRIWGRSGQSHCGWRDPTVGATALLAVRRQATAISRPRLLTEQAIASLAREALGTVSAQHCSWLKHTSGGNPFYLRELLRGTTVGASSPEHGGLAGSGGHGGAGRHVPPWWRLRQLAWARPGWRRPWRCWVRAGPCAMRRHWPARTPRRPCTPPWRGALGRAGRGRPAALPASDRAPGGRGFVGQRPACAAAPGGGRRVAC